MFFNLRRKKRIIPKLDLGSSLFFLSCYTQLLLMASKEKEALRKKQSNVVHELKSENEYWEAVRSGQKSFEIRMNDRAFHVGDELILHRAEPILLGGVPFKRLKGLISYVMPGGKFGLSAAYVILQLKEIHLLSENLPP